MSCHRPARSTYNRLHCMQVGPVNDVTQLLDAIAHGDQQASDQLLPLVYDELRMLAARKLANEPPGQTIQATALVHDAFVRLVDVETQQKWNSRGHFYCAAAEAMRRILVENARKKRSLKRGGDWARQELPSNGIAAAELKHDLLALDEALTKLDEEEPIKARLVELRFFAGMTVEEAANTLEISTITAKRYWRYARAWLHREIVE